MGQSVALTAFAVSLQGLLAQLEAESSAVAALPLVVAALYVQLYSRALQAPGRAMAAAIARLKASARLFVVVPFRLSSRSQCLGFAECTFD
jgi:hypothetical protein